MRLGPVEIDRKVDLLALTAFIISILTATYQLGVLIRGPNATLLPPEGVTVARYETRNGSTYLSVIAPVAIVNSSTAREPLIVTVQEVVVRVADMQFTLRWHDQIGHVDGTGEGLEFLESRAVAPIIVPSLEINSSLTRFTPQRAPCRLTEPDCTPNDVFVEYSEITSAIKSALQKGEKTMSVTHWAHFNNYKALSSTCIIPLHFGLLSQLRSGYFMELCLK